MSASYVYKLNAVQQRRLTVNNQTPNPHYHPTKCQYSCITMKASTILTAVALIFASSVSAQTACDPVASAVPTCGVREPPPSRSLTPTNSRTQANIATRSHASRPPLQRLAVVAATTDAAAPALRPSRPQLKAASSATAVSLQRCRSRPLARPCAPVLLLLQAIWLSLPPSRQRLYG